MAFPVFKSSAAQRNIYKLSPNLFEQSQKAPKPKQVVKDGYYTESGLIGPNWPALFDLEEVNELAPKVAKQLQELYDGANKAADQIAQVWKDRRFTPDGQRAKAVEVLDVFIAAHVSWANKTLRENANRLESVLGILKAPAPDSTAPEWRSLVRASGDTPERRMVELAKLLRDGNNDVATAVAAAGAGLSGLNAAQGDTLAKRIKIAGNEGRFKAIMIEGGMLDALRLGIVRTVNKLARDASLTPEQHRGIESSLLTFPEFDRLASQVEAFDGAVSAVAALTMGQIEDGEGTTSQSSEA